MPNNTSDISVLIATDCISKDRTYKTATNASTTIFTGTPSVSFSVSGGLTVSAAAMSNSTVNSGRM
jgi:hypothetical protein